jgi:hypothetical protein
LRSLGIGLKVRFIYRIEAPMPVLRSSFAPSLVIALLLLACAGEVLAGEDSPVHRTIERVLQLLPRQPVQVVVVDASQAAGDTRRALLQMDAFITKGGREVYVTAHNEALRRAVEGSSLHEYVLATIIWHEMAHIDGADESEAQRREEALWSRFVLDQRVHPMDGLRYLNALKERRRGKPLVPSDSEQVLRGPLITSPIAIVGRTGSPD